MQRHRPHRRNYNDVGHAHELTFSCYGRQQLLRSEIFCTWLAAAIESARLRYRFDLWAFVFMPEHEHLIIHPQEAVYDIASIRKGIKAPLAARVIKHLSANDPDRLAGLTRERGNRVERLFWQSGGGYDRNITQAGTLERMIEICI